MIYVQILLNYITSNNMWANLKKYICLFIAFIRSYNQQLFLIFLSSRLQLVDMIILIINKIKISFSNNLLIFFQSTADRISFNEFYGTQFYINSLSIGISYYSFHWNGEFLFEVRLNKMYFIDKMKYFNLHNWKYNE
jgi:hypothetical protein